MELPSSLFTLVTEFVRAERVIASRKRHEERARMNEYIRGNLEIEARSYGNIECVFVQAPNLEFRVCRNALGIAPVFKINVNIDLEQPTVRISAREDTIHPRPRFCQFERSSDTLTIKQLFDRLIHDLGRSDDSNGSSYSEDDAIDGLCKCLDLIIRNHRLFRDYW